MAIDRLLKEATNAAKTPDGIMRSFFRRMYGQAIKDAFEDVMGDVPDVLPGVAGQVSPGVAGVLQSQSSQTVGDIRETLSFFGKGISTEFVDSGEAFIAAILSMAEEAGATADELGQINFNRLLQDGLRSLGGGAFRIEPDRIQDQSEVSQRVLGAIAPQLTSEAIEERVRRIDVNPADTAPAPSVTNRVQEFFRQFTGQFNALANLISPARGIPPSDNEAEPPQPQGIDALLNAIGDIGNAPDGSEEELVSSMNDLIESTNRSAGASNALGGRITQMIGRLAGQATGGAIRAGSGVLQRAAEVVNSRLPEGLRNNLQQGAASLGQRVAPLVGASPAAGARAGAALGALAPPVLAAIVAFNMLKTIVGAAWRGLDKLGRVAEATTNRIAQYNGTILGAQAGLDFGRVVRDINLGAAVGGSSAEVIAARNDLENAQQPINELMTRAGNEWLQFKLQLQTSVLTLFNPLIELANKTLAWLDDDTPNPEWDELKQTAIDGFRMVPQLALLGELLNLANEAWGDHKAKQRANDEMDIHANQLRAFEALRDGANDPNARRL